MASLYQCRLNYALSAVAVAAVLFGVAASASAGGTDCNSNGTPDGEEIPLSAGTATDGCSVALNINVGTYTGTTATAAADGDTAGCIQSDISPDRYYRYTPSVSGLLTVSTCAMGQPPDQCGTEFANYDGLLSIHSGCPATTANSVGCDDDGCGTGGGPSTVTIPVVGGTEYVIRITGWNGTCGDYIVTISGPGAMGDCNGNGVPDDCDITGVTSGDCDTNGVPDECQPGGAVDCNSNGTVDACETIIDCNLNGILDECDIGGGASDDCNADGTPDECQGPDCDGNGIPDECDIAGGSGDCDNDGAPDVCEPDCNANGTPDDCETFTDCNSNGAPDDCDILLGLYDCNTNGIPDDCDIAGASEDCQPDGIPDECQLGTRGAVYDGAFEPPVYSGSASGVLMPGQDLWFIPVVGSQPFNIYTYAGNTLSVPSNPTGGLQFAAGISVVTPVPPTTLTFARTQRDGPFGANVWEVSYDFLGRNQGVLPAANNLGSFSMNPAPNHWIHLFVWVDITVGTKYQAGYLGYNADGIMDAQPGRFPTPAWQNLDVNKWYRFTTIVNFTNNRMIRFKLTDLASGVTTTAELPDAYMAGGLVPPPLPTQMRMFAGGTSNLSAWDNLIVTPAPPPGSDENDNDIPDDCEGAVPGDHDDDGDVDSDDQAIFVAVLILEDMDPAHVAAADINGDLVADAGDIAGMVALLIAP